MTSSSSSVVPTAATQALACSATALRPRRHVAAGDAHVLADDQRDERQAGVGQHQAVDELAGLGASPP